MNHDFFIFNIYFLDKKIISQMRFDFLKLFKEVAFVKTSRVIFMSFFLFFNLIFIMNSIIRIILKKIHRDFLKSLRKNKKISLILIVNYKLKRY